MSHLTDNTHQSAICSSKNKSIYHNNILYDKLAIEEVIASKNINYQLFRSLTWGCINAFVLAITGFDLMDRCSTPLTSFQIFELIIALFSFLNIFYHVCCYIYYLNIRRPVDFPILLREMSGYSSEDSSCGSKSDTSGKSRTSLNITAFSFDRSQRNESDSNPNVLDLFTNTPLKNVVNRKCSPSVCVENYGNASLALRSSEILSPYTKGKELIENDDVLNDYLNEYINHEKFNAVVFADKNATDSSPIWSHPSSLEPAERVRIMNNKYQLAYSAADNSSTLSKNKTSPLQLGDADFWKQRGLNPKHIPFMCDDLRMWISSTILIRIASEINLVNEHFIKHGQSDLRIGHTCLDRLRKNKAQYLAHGLNTLLPFLEYSNNHNYVVHRIMELAKSKHMSDFRWNSGSLLYNGKPWDTNLPTDSALIMHLIATYLDSQLVPLPQQPDGKPFSSQYLSTNVSEKPVRVPGKFKIHQTQINPPSYVLVTDTVINVPLKGRNNLFHTLILFLHYLHTKHNGMLGRVSLGPAGINVLWVIGVR
uniref:Putative cytochrome n=1 Tax=Xenopsylla cheopis TaxID=163159 RepID=A0A6M2DHF4_XENCH